MVRSRWVAILTVFFFSFGESLTFLSDGFLLSNQILSMLLERSVNPDVLNCNKQVMISCVLLVLVFQ